MVFNRYAAGAKVYNGGSSAATQGMADPMGYILRERLKRRVSKSRAGNAKAALERSARMGRAKVQPGVDGTRKRTPMAGRVKNQPGVDGTRKHTPMARRVKDKPKPKPRGGGGKPKPDNKPKVNIHNNGVLDLPWNTANQLQAIAAQNRLSDTLNQNNAQLGSYMTQYEQTLRDAAFDKTRLDDQTLDTAASRGMAFSSGYAQQAEDNYTNYNNYLSGLAQDKTDFRNQVTLSNRDAKNDFYGTLRELALSQGIDLSEFAGELGLSRAQARGLGGKKKDHKPGGKHHKPGGKHHKPGGGKPHRRRRNRK